MVTNELGGRRWRGVHLRLTIDRMPLRRSGLFPDSKRPATKSDGTNNSPHTADSDVIQERLTESQAVVVLSGAVSRLRIRQIPLHPAREYRRAAHRLQRVAACSGFFVVDCSGRRAPFSPEWTVNL